MTGAERVVSTAAKETGYLEKTSNARLDEKTANAGSANYTKYWRDVYPQYQGQPWCDCFVSWIFMQTFGKETADKLLCGGLMSFYTPTSANYFRKQNRFYTAGSTPKVGDQIFFKNGGTICHTGIVVDVTGGRVYTIEGNTSGDATLVSNGGAVARKNYALSSSYIAGYGRPDWTIVDGRKFAPNRTLTRAEAVMFLWRLWGSPEPVEKASFEDVKSTAYYAKAAAWACENGITAGKGKNLFAPDDYCTRGQFCTFMFKASNGTPEKGPVDLPFVDVPEHAYYYDAVVWAWKHNIASGTSSNSFAPNAKVTRAQAVMMLWAANGRSKAPTASKFSDVTDKAYYKDAVDWAVAEGITSGVS